MSDKSAQELYNDWLAVKDARGMLWWNEAGLIYELKQGAYKDVFGQCESWKSFVAECGELLSTVDYKAGIWERFIVELKMEPKDFEGINHAKLRLAKTKATKGNVKHIVSLARELSLGDFVKELKEL